MNENQIRVLLVEDDPDDARLVRVMLAEAGQAGQPGGSGFFIDLGSVERVSEAAMALAGGDWDLILLDLSLPDAHGLEALYQLRAAASHLPIVVMSGLANEAIAIQAVQEGAQDYLVKGTVDSSLLTRAIRYAIERKRSEQALRDSMERIHKLNRVYTVLSDINQAIVRIREPQALFEKACHIAVEKGQFRLAWIGLVDDSTQRIQVAAYAGKAGDYLDKMTISLRDEVPYCPVDSALRQKGSVICNVIEQDEHLVPCQKKALELGCRSCASFPLLVSGAIRGAFTICADTPDYFDAEEIKLLDELAKDISFAMEFAEKEAERRRGEQALQEKEVTFRLLFANHPHPMWVYDLETLKFLEVNEAAIARYGYTRDEFFQMRITDIRPLEEIPRLMDNLAQERPALQTSGPWQHRLKSGEIIFVEISSHTLEFASRPAVLVVALDVTERLRAESQRADLLAQEQQARQEAEAARQRLSILVEASTLLSETLDYSERLERVAQVAVPAIADWCTVDVLEEDGSLRRVTMIHKDPTQLKRYDELRRRYPRDPDSQFGVYNVLRAGQSMLYSDVAYESPLVSARDEGQVTLGRELGVKSAMLVPLIDQGRPRGVLTLAMAESGRRYGPDDLALAKDIARRAASLIEHARLYNEIQMSNVELEKRVAERTAQLEATNKELEAFSYSVSHDLRAPLRHAAGYVELLREHAAGTLDDKSNRYLSIIAESATRMGALIDDLLTFSRIGRADLHSTQFDFKALVQDVIRELQPEARGHPVAWDIGPLPGVLADRSLMRLVWVNLLANALKYTRPRLQAEITIECTSTTQEDIFSVRDNGVGFDMKYADKLFGVFQRLHRAEEFEGTGIGLATVQRIIHRHGGRVWAEGAVEAGATFYFSLPKGEERRPHDA